MKRHRWTGRVLVLALVVAMIGVLLPDPAHAQKNVTSTYDMRIRGYVQMNVTWDSDENTGDSANTLRTFAPVKGSAEEGRETLRWGAFRTRLAVDVRGPDVWGAKSRAYIETDFDGFQDGNTAAHTPRLRHAYMRFDWPQFYVLIGQTTMLFTSAVSTAAELSGVTSGARGDITGGSRNRTPQIQVGTSIPMMGAKLDLAGSIARNSADARQGDTNLNDSGARAMTPAVSAIATATVKLFGRDAVFSGSWFHGEETFICTTITATCTAKTEADVDNNGLSFEWLLPLGPAIPGLGALDFRGNYFTGENMDRVMALGGVTSTNPTANPSEIQADGWWAEIFWGINKNFAVLAGMGRMEADTGDLIKAGGTQVEKNEGKWVAAQYQEGPFLLEVLYGFDLETTRLATSTGVRTDTDAQALHLIFRYRF